jgi:hypothetical protein
LAFPDPDDDHPLGAVPNRGAVQRDITLGGVRYLQTITDVIRVPNRDPRSKDATPIHLEPGLWVIIEPTQHPAQSQPTVARMASIPHGTTVNAQGTSFTKAGGPQIDPVDITPFVQGDPSNRIHTFPSLKVANAGTPRIPQDLSIAPEITQEVLDNPNLLLEQHVDGLNIVSTDVIQIATTSAAIPGGGTANIGFLVGDSTGPNALAADMSAIFWVETIQTQFEVGPLKVGESQNAVPTVPTGAPAPVFRVTATSAIPNAKQFPAQYTQIQYTQNVSLNFKTLTWPHVSVATLVPLKPIALQL